MTGAYRRAAEALNQHGFVLLVGEPAAGKTTIASMLSMGALDQWGASTLKLDEAGKVVDRWNPDEPSQFFWIDDAFGVTQYESHLVHAWNHALTFIRTMLRKGTKVVMTSRDYIYKRARNDLKEGAFPLFRESQVVIDVCDLTLDEKQQMLYNHLKLGKQGRAFKGAIKPHLQSIAGHPRFVPETARRLSDPLFTGGMNLIRDELHDFVEKQEQFLQEVLRGLDTHSKAALALIFMRNGSLESPIELRASERSALERLESTLGGCITALESLGGSLVQLVHGDGPGVWRFKHPTVGDAYAALLLQSPELLEIYVRGVPIDRLTMQITCGDVGLEHAVIVPKALFPIVLERLTELSSLAQFKSAALSSWHNRGRLDAFLSSRCSKDFLSMFIARRPDVLDRVSSPGLFLNSVSEVDLAIRLNELGILPEECRLKFINTVTSYAIDGEDLYAIESLRIQSVFKATDLSDFRAKIRAELLPNLAEIRLTWQSNHSSEQRSDEHMQPLLDSLDALKKEFSGESAILDDIQVQVARAQEWISDHLPAESDGTRAPRSFGGADPQPQIPVQHRGIFDDVDE